MQVDAGLRLDYLGDGGRRAGLVVPLVEPVVLVLARVAVLGRDPERSGLRRRADRIVLGAGQAQGRCGQVLVHRDADGCGRGELVLGRNMAARNVTEPRVVVEV